MPNKRAKMAKSTWIEACITSTNSSSSRHPDTLDGLGLNTLGNNVSNVVFKLGMQPILFVYHQL